MTTTQTIHVALYDSLADWEVGHLLAELRTGHFTGTPVRGRHRRGDDRPDHHHGRRAHAARHHGSPSSTRPRAALLVLPGGELYDAGGGEAFADAARRFVDAGVPVAAICGATAGLARAGLLDTRRHTSAAAEYLAYTGYAGGEHYIDERAVADGDVITAGPAVTGAVRARDARRTSELASDGHAGRLRGRVRPRRRLRLPDIDGRVSEHPPREEWPVPPPLSEAGAALTDVVLETFRLNAGSRLSPDIPAPSSRSCSR